MKKLFKYLMKQLFCEVGIHKFEVSSVQKFSRGMELRTEKCIYCGETNHNFSEFLKFEEKII